MTDTPKREQSISIRFPLDVLDRIRKLAKEHERSFNGEVIWALREYAKHHPISPTPNDETERE